LPLITQDYITTILLKHYQGPKRNNKISHNNRFYHYAVLRVFGSVKCVDI